MQSVLDGFISKFVLCSKCENPETILSIRNGEIFRTCKACGNKSLADNTHKICSFIRTNPPPKPVKVKQAKDNAAANVDNGRENEVVEGMVAPEGFDDSLANIDGKLDEDDWDEEVAAASREDDLAEKFKEVLDIEEDEDPLEVFGDFLVKNVDSISDERIYKEIKERGLKNDKAVAVIVQVLFVTDFVKSIKTRSTLLKGLLKTSRDQLAFLGALDRLASIHDTSILKKVPLILQSLYSFDLVEESVLLEWRGHVSKRYVSKEQGEKVRVAAEPFFKWLEQADESASD